MSISQEELMFLQSQLEGLESIFLELIPFGVELRRQQVQDYYDKRFDNATKPVASVAETELRRQFNTKANQVRNLVDSAESFGEAGNRLNLIRAAASLPAERNKPLHSIIAEFCQKLIYEGAVDQSSLQEILSQTELTPVEVRVLLGSLMFLIVDELDNGGQPMLVCDLLNQLLNFISSSKLLEVNDPFLIEAQCALEAIKEEST
ncbi:MAG: hypothetical protein HY711_11755 [Candidatus Melainabacteria bacterium]|nr:hypothetical protein [Candidatus Melainabacteria bacterium]